MLGEVRSGQVGLGLVWFCEVRSGLVWKDGSSLIKNLPNKL